MTSHAGSTLVALGWEMADHGVSQHVIPAPPGHWLDGRRLIDGEWVKESYPVVAFAWRSDGYRDTYVVTENLDPVRLDDILDGENFRGLGYRVDPAATHQLYDEPDEATSQDGQ
jgi:hypothetical protein